MSYLAVFYFNCPPFFIPPSCYHLIGRHENPMILLVDNVLEYILFFRVCIKIFQESHMSKVGFEPTTTEVDCDLNIAL